MTQTPKEESEILLNSLLPFAEQQLQKYGEFFPFAATLSINDQVKMLATYDGDEHRDIQKLIIDMEQAFVRGVKNNEYKATALAYMVAVSNPDTGKTENAVCINLNHLKDFSIQLIYSYTISKKLLGKNLVQFFEPKISKGEGKIFGIKN